MNPSRTFSCICSLIGLISILALTNCSSTHQASLADNQTSIHKARKQRASVKDPRAVKPNEDRPSNLSLADMLQRVPGVNVSGSGMNVSVQVRGVSSFNLSNEPLYVVDGVPVGSSYASVATTLNPNEIKRIKLLTGSEATLYGVRGANGVILITRK